MKIFNIFLITLTFICQTLSSRETLFAKELFKAIDSKDNLVFSPFSIYACLGLTYLGASGETAKELANALRFRKMDKIEIADKFETILGNDEFKNRMQMANLILFNNNLAKSYKFSSNLYKKYFNSEARLADFSQGEILENRINSLVKNMTNGEIDSVFAPGTIDRDTSVMLINAISFKGKWASPFPAINTLTMDFYPNSNQAQKVEFMFDEDYFNFGIIEKLDAKILELSYKNCNLSMIILLPNQMDGLENLIKEFHKEYYFDQISKSLSFENKVDVYIPKFKMDFEIDLKSSLLKMGVKTMFTSEANFRDFFEGIAPKLTVSKVSHKAEIKVDEEGAEASASTYIKAYPMSLDLGKKTFKADHPFIWYIKDKKDNIYFMGQVVDLTVNL